MLKLSVRNYPRKSRPIWIFNFSTGFGTYNHWVLETTLLYWRNSYCFGTSKNL